MAKREALVVPLATVALLSVHLGLLFVSAPDGARRRRELRFTAGAFGFNGSWILAGGP